MGLTPFPAGSRATDVPVPAAATAVIAHRGAWGEARENSLAAFERAIALSADMIEFDVRRTGDGCLVVHHDAHLYGVRLASLTAADLAWAGARSPPRLDEVLELAKGRIAVDVELGLTDQTLPVAGHGGEESAPLVLPAREVPAEWIDYNGHVHESRYLQLFADATDALLRVLGVDAAYLESGGSYYTVETHLSHLRQLFAGDRVQVRTQLLGWDDKRLHIFHSLLRGDEHDPVATAEQMLLHVDAAAGRVGPVKDGVRDHVRALADRHAALPHPGPGRSQHRARVRHRSNVFAIVA